MQTVVNCAWIWSVPIAALAIVALVLLQRPKWLWRPIVAREAEMPLALLIVVSLMSLAAWSMAVWHSQKIVDLGTIAPRELRPGEILRLAFGFLHRGFAGDITHQAHMQVAITFGAIAVALGYLALRMRYSLFAIDVVQLDNAAQRRVVVMGLSDLRADLDHGPAIAALSTLSLTDASTAAVGMFPWQQNLRVLAHHLVPRPDVGHGWLRFWRRWRSEATRAHVVVLPSVESVRRAGEFKALVEACLIKSGITNATIEVWPQPANYNDLIELREAFRSIVRTLRQRSEIEARLDEISIDTTAGFKIFSIAGATITFAGPLEFTYVETAAPNRVMTFDVRAEFRRRLELR